MQHTRRQHCPTTATLASLCIAIAAVGCEIEPGRAFEDSGDIDDGAASEGGDTDDTITIAREVEPSTVGDCGYSGVFNRFDGRIFDLATYRELYPNLHGTDQELRDHWNNHGLGEGRAAHHSFKVQEYAANYEALLAAYTTATGCVDFVGLAHHYLLNATHEKRHGTAAEKDANTPQPQVYTPEFSVALAAGPSEFYDHDTDGSCASRPDANIRGFVDDSGLTQLTMGDVDSYRFVELPSNAGVFAKDCQAPILSSDLMLSPGPSQYRDYEWVMSTYSRDGSTVHALVHNEHHYGFPFGSALFNRNQKMSVTQFVSHDAGQSFAPDVSNGFLLAFPPEANRVLDPINDNPDPPPGPGDPPDTTGLTNVYGFFEPSNIIRSPEDNAYYVLVHQKPDPRGGADQGVCLLRNLDIEDASGWRAWDGENFTVPLNQGQLCQPLANIVVMRSSLTYNTTLGEFLLVGFPLGEGSTEEETDNRKKLSFSHAADLRGPWSVPQPIDTSALPGEAFRAASAGGVHGYPSVIDHEIKSANFTYSGGHPSLYITEFAVDETGAASTARRVMRYELEIR